LIVDALHVFGVRLNDAEAMNLMNRLSQQLRMLDSKKHAGKGGERSSTRTLRQRDIYLRSTAGRTFRQRCWKLCASQRAIAITYMTPRIGKPMETKEYPLLLVFHERGWYCITRNLKSKTYQPRRLDRIRSCSILNRCWQSIVQ